MALVPIKMAFTGASAICGFLHLMSLESMNLVVYVQGLKLKAAVRKNETDLQLHVNSRRIADGSHGSVWSGHCQVNDEIDDHKDVAIKFITLDDQPTSDQLTTMQTEIDIAERLSATASGVPYFLKFYGLYNGMSEYDFRCGYPTHKNFAVLKFEQERSWSARVGIKKILSKSIRDYMNTGSVALVFEDMPDGTLEHFMQSNTFKKLGNDEKVIVAKQVAQKLLEAVRTLQELRIAHLDIKPSNILVDVDITGKNISNIKLIDFGLALQNQSHDPDRKIDSQLKGKKAYQSPVRHQGKATLPFKDDLWSAGIVLFQMLNPSAQWGTPTENQTEIQKWQDRYKNENFYSAIAELLVDDERERSLENAIGFLVTPPV